MSSGLLVLALVRDAETRDFAKVVLGEQGHHVIDFRNCRQACALLQSGRQPDLLLVEHDKSRPGEQEEYQQLVFHSRKDSVCLILGLGEQEQLEHARRAGITRFLMKPVTRQDLLSVIDELSDEPTLRRRDNEFPLTSKSVPTVQSSRCPAVPYLEELGDNHFFLAASPSMLEIYRQVKLLAEVNVTVLILGESGTGKEVVAHLIHQHSRRSRQMFLNVNCAALPMELLESELFGHRQGAFTGAIKDKPGKFELANGGTLLLDEIGEINAQMQAKLLHVLQDGRFTRLGGQQSTKVDTRIIAATNIDIAAALADKTFREDLYYRLNAFTIKVPPLRERREEIPYLVEETIRRTPSEMKSGMDNFGAQLMNAMLEYDWPGNLRELRNFVTRTIIMQDYDGAFCELESKIAATGSTARQEHTPMTASSNSGMRSIVRDVKARTELRMIQEALDASGWNRRNAARDLNISYRALLYKIQQHRLTPGMPRV
jgi:DNA-binding NtrC family response regulator